MAHADLSPNAILQPSSGWLNQKVHHLPVRVYFEDTDWSGVVYHARYLHFMERARTEFLRVTGYDQGINRDLGVFAVTHLALQYRRPARFDDALFVQTRLGSVGAARLVLHQRVMRLESEAEPVLLTQAEVTAAVLSQEGRPQRLDPVWRARWRALVTDSFDMQDMQDGHDQQDSKGDQSDDDPLFRNPPAGRANPQGVA